MPTATAPGNAGAAAPQEAGFEAGVLNPWVTEGFLLPDLADPAELEPGGIPFETFEGKASIARAGVDWRFRVPEETSRNGSVIITHGLGAKQGAYSGLADFLASHGIATADYKAAHSQGWLAGLHPKHLFDASRLLYQAPWGVIRDIQQRDDIEAPTDKFSIAGHSLGGRTAVVNALRHPDAVDHVITIDSIGLEDHHVPGLAGRLPFFFGKDFKGAIAGDELETEEKIKLVINGVVYFIENPVRSAGEILSLGRARIGDDIVSLGELGIGSGIVVSPEDSLLNPRKAEERSANKPDVFVHLPKLPDKTLDHMGPVRYPGVYGRVAISLLRHLDETRH